ncbi:MAG: amidohydrolase [Sciscionella sp.]|nr:amidohydrolase [Sciscionella sp.]
MTVLDSRPEPKGAGGAHRRADVLITENGVSLASVPDLGAGNGPVWLDDWLARNRADLVAWRRHLHAHPELSRDEHATTELIAGMLLSIGLKPRVLSCGTGLICDIGADGDSTADGTDGKGIDKGTNRRCVALRADIDALPLTESTGLPYASTVDGVAHACGHDAHTTMLLGAAHALAAAPELPGTIRLIFQPAEESMPGGALDVIAAGGLDGVDRIFGLHCNPHLRVGKIGTKTGAITSATDLLELRLTSPGGHTSRPHLTADLVHALGSVITGLPALLSRRVDPRSGTVLVWGAVHAGDAPNAVPQDGVLRGTLRTADHGVWNELEPLVAGAVQSLLAPTGVGFDLRHQRGVPPVVNDPDSTRLLATGVEAALGEAALASTEQSSGGEDFAWYLEHVPGAFARIGVWDGTLPQSDLHSPTFTMDERALPIGTRVLVNTAIAALSG